MFVPVSQCESIFPVISLRAAMRYVLINISTSLEAEKIAPGICTTHFNTFFTAII